MKHLGWRLAVGLILCLLGALAAPAALAHSGQAGESEIHVHLNGRPVAFPDTQPLIRAGRTLVPLRALVEALGARVDWDAGTRTATVALGPRVVTLAVDSSTAAVDGRAVPLDVPAQIVGGRTLVPLRFLVEALGAQVQWEAATRTIHVALDLPGAALSPALARILDQAQAVWANSDYEGTFTSRVTGGPVAVTVNGTVKAQVRGGSEMLMEMAMQANQMADPLVVKVAVHGGQAWVQPAPAAGWQRVDLQALSATQMPGTDIWKDFRALVRSARPGGQVQAAGRALQEVHVVLDPAKAIKQVQQGIQAQIGAALPPGAGMEVKLEDLSMTLLVDPATGAMAGMRQSVRAAIDLGTPAGRLSLGSETQVEVWYRPSTAPIQWPEFGARPQ